MSKKRKNSLRRTQRALYVLLPFLLLSLAVLLILNHRLQHTDGTLQTATVGADADGSDTSSEADWAQTDSKTDFDADFDADSADASAGDNDGSVEDDESDMQAPTIEPNRSPEPVTMLFTGDVYLSDYVLGNYNNSGIEGVVSPVLLNELQTADITIINNEFPFSTRGEQAPDKQFTFRVNPDYVSVLTEMGVDIAGLANNHVLDYGSDALLDTFETLDGAGIDYMGAGADLSRASALITKEVNGQTFGFLAASRVIPVVSWDIRNASPGVFTTYDPALLIEAIASARETCDYLTVFVHWGIERDEYPQDYQVTMAQQYIDAGADLVIGAHPHVLQGITYYKDKPVFYSLGNFIFNQEIARTAAVKVTVPNEGEPTIRIIAASASGAYTSASDGEKRTDTYDYLESISEGISIDENGILTQKPE